MTTDPREPAGYMPQLDSLRTLAVAGVLIHHYVPSDAALHRIDFGGMGVRLFFVLSGFLITGILLRSREGIEANRRTSGAAIKQFYIRRSLRIFPLYYFILLLAFSFNVGDIRQTIAWYALYLTNVLMAVRADNGVPLAHFWTLAVEEQFYLVWPWLILFLPRRALAPALIACIVIAPLFRYLSHIAGLNQIAINALPFSSLDSLGAGSLLAYLREREPRATMTRLVRYGLAAGLILFAIGLIVPKIFEYGVWRTAIAPLMYPLVFVWLIDGAAQGFRGLFGTLLSLPPITALGRVSYGLYVYHVALLAIVPPIAAAAGYPIMHVLNQTFGRIGIEPSTSPGTLFGFLFWTTLTIAVSALSWVLVERPFNRLKDRFA